MCFRQMWWPGSHLELDCDHLNAKLVVLEHYPCQVCKDSGRWFRGKCRPTDRHIYRSPMIDMEGDRSKI